MNKKDILFIRKAVANPETSAVIKITTCFVNINSSETTIQDTVPFLSVAEDEAELYCSYLKKGMGAKMDKNAFCATDKTTWIKELLDSGLNDRSLIDNACSRISESFGSNENYSILFALCASPETKAAGSFPFLIIMIQPCTLDKPGIIYDYKAGQFEARKKEHGLGVPEQTFLYPALSNLAPDPERVLCVSRNAKVASELRGFTEDLFGCTLQPSEEEQKEIFRNIIAAGFEAGKAPYECVKDVVDQINELTSESALSGEVKAFSPDALADTLIKSGCIDKDKAEIVRSAAKEAGNIRFNPELLLDKTISIETDTATVKVDKLDLDQIRVQTIDGEECYVIPARNAVIAGIAVKG